MIELRAERDRLLAAMAMRTGLVRPEDLAAADPTAAIDAADGNAGASRSLADRLAATGRLGPAERQALETLVEAHLAGRGDPEATRSLAALASTARHEPGPSTAPGAPVPAGDGAAEALAPLAGRYRPIRLHARGGLGEVHLARDEELGREVALKVIRPDQAGDPGGRARFVVEAEVTGGLEHPGIVPVYGLGRDEGGRPCYAMRFIRGESLQDAIARYHAGAGVDPGARALAFRDLLGRFVAACNAVAYAHSRGVLHRDIKPANIMLGPFGETLVVDWGLAKLTGQAGPDGRPGPAAGPLEAASASDSDATQPGTVMGTPHYMSPEQAAGTLDRLGPATDVYGLGATLYALLVGRPPFASAAGRRVDEVLNAVQAGDFPPPRSAEPGVPRALEAACLKAMARRPEDRYASPVELAADVDRWLAGEPVSADREPWPERLGRWARRHRAPVAAGAALLVAAVVGLAVGAALLAAANGRTEARRLEALANARQARDNAEEARRNADRALENFGFARDAVMRYLVTITESRLLDQPYMSELKAELLGSAREFFETFLERARDDPGAAYDLAVALYRLGEIEAAIGRNERAVENLSRSLEQYDAAIRARPEQTLYRGQRVALLHRLGNGLRDLGREAEGDEAHRRAIAEAEALLAAEPESLPLRVLLVDLLTARARVVDQHGEFDAAEALHRRSTELLDGVPQAERDRPSYRDVARKLAGTVGRLAFIRGRYEESREAHRRALAHAEALVRLHPDSFKHRDALAGCLVNLIGPEVRLGRLDEALRLAERGAAIFRDLIREHPEFFDTREGLSRLLINASVIREKLGRLDEAARDSLEALDIQEVLARTYPDNFEHALAYAMNLGNLGNTELASGKAGDALGRFDRSLEVLEQVLARTPGNRTARQTARNSAWGKADALVALGRPREAVAAFDRAIGAAEGRPRDELRMERAAALARAGDADAAAREAEGGLALADAFHRFLAARALALASASASDPDHADALARRALGGLARLDDEGWFDRPDRLARLRRPEFSALSGRPDFRDFLADVGFPRDPFGPPPATR